MSEIVTYNVYIYSYANLIYQNISEQSNSKGAEILNPKLSISKSKMLIKKKKCRSKIDNFSFCFASIKKFRMLNKSNECKSCSRMMKTPEVTTVLDK